MSGALIQLATPGAQDTRLSENPDITFWKHEYKQHSRFAIESIEQHFTGEAGFGKKVTFEVSRIGDLLSGLTLQTVLPALDATHVQQTGTPSGGQANTDDLRASYVNSIGHAMIESVTVYIGGSQVDKHYGLWMEIWSELSTPDSKKAGYDSMIGRYGTMADAQLGSEMQTTLLVPFSFWFCRAPGLALPLVALPHNQVRVEIEFRTVQQCVVAMDASTGARVANGVDLSGATASVDYSLTAAGKALKFDYCQMYGEYVFLDVAEREMFLKEEHMYLINQLQYSYPSTYNLSNGNPTYTHEMNFSHPVKELIWVLRQQDVAPSAGDITKNDWFNFGTAGAGETETSTYTGDLIDSDLKAVGIRFNNYPRFQPRPPQHFRLEQPWEYHTRVPANTHIYLYSFCLQPESSHPTGSINMSRIDNAHMQFKLSDNTKAAGSPFGTGKTADLYIFATNWNYLKIVSGMGGPVYAS